MLAEKSHTLTPTLALAKNILAAMDLAPHASQSKHEILLEKSMKTAKGY